MTKQTFPNIHLRAIEPEDIEFLYEIENDPELWSVGVTNVPYSRYALCEYLANTRNDIYADRQLRLVIEDADDQSTAMITPVKVNDSVASSVDMLTPIASVSERTIGIVDLMNFDPRHMRAEVGIVIQKKYRRMGYARAALAKTVFYAMQTLHLHQLYAVIAIDNDASLNLFESAGFVRSATLNEWLNNNGTYQNAYLMQFF